MTSSGMPREAHQAPTPPCRMAPSAIVTFEGIRSFQLLGAAAGFRTYITCENPLFGPDVSPDFTLVWLKDCDPIIRKDIEHIPNTQALKGIKQKG